MFNLRFINIPNKTITNESILELTELVPRKICFNSSHSNALKRKAYKESIGSFSVPFHETILPFFERETHLKLFHNQKIDNYWCSIFSEEDFLKIEEFISKHKKIVFIRDNLDLSIALSENFIDDERTKIGLLEYDAKYNKNKKSVKKLAKICSKWINKLQYYNHSDYICAIPSSTKDKKNLPQKIATKLKGFEFENISEHISWSSDKQALKEIEYSQKLDFLNNIGLDIKIDLKGKNVILLDDLYQSGITMQYVAMKLKEAGASRVFGLAIVKSRSNKDNL